jgi:hypothetical protein
VEKNIVGLKVDGTGSTGKGAHVLIRESIVAGNAADGIRVTSAPGKAPTFIIVERSAAVNNAGTGIRVEGPHTTVLLRDSVTTGNDTALSTVNGGQLISYRQKPAELPYRPVRQQLQQKADASADINLAVLQADSTSDASSLDPPQVAVSAVAPTDAGSGASRIDPPEVTASPVLQTDTSPDARRRDSPEVPVSSGHAAIEDVNACPSLPKLTRLKLHSGKTSRRRLAGSVAASYSFAKMRKMHRFRRATQTAIYDTRGRVSPR